MPKGRKRQESAESPPSPNRGPWDVDLVCAYLDSPTLILENPGLSQWIQERGGLGAIDDYLRQQRLSKDDHNLLNLIFDHPMEGADFYAQQICSSRTTFYRRRLGLAEQLARYLNIWTLVQSSSSAKVKVPEPAPAIASNPHPSSHLPITTTALLGREQELSLIQSLLQNMNVRLITFTGPGGIGKTRLAIETGSLFQSLFNDGTWFVSIASVRELPEVPLVIARNLKLIETSEQNVEIELIKFFADKKALLILDNLEQIIEASQFIQRILLATQYLKIIVTSRIPTQINLEQELIIQPLSLPKINRKPSLEVLAQNPSIRLFIDRSCSIRPAFTLNTENISTIMAICHRLEGIPLAIELAAAKARLLSVDEILARLEKPLQILTSNLLHIPQRQQTMRNAIAWSYELLSPSEQYVFAQLSIFAPGWTTAAAEKICNTLENSPSILDILDSLLLNNLIYDSNVDNDQPRFFMLETIKEFAYEQRISKQELDSCYSAHIYYYANLCELAEGRLRGRECVKWANQIDQDLPNIRMAFGYSLSNSIEDAVRIVTSLWYFWVSRGRIQEGYALAKSILPFVKNISLPLSIKLLCFSGNMALNVLEYDLAEELLSICLELAKQSGDYRSCIQVQSYLIKFALLRGDYIQSKYLVDSCIKGYKNLRDNRGLAYTLRDLSDIYQFEGDYDKALDCYVEGINLYNIEGDEYNVALSMGYIADLLIHLDQTEQAWKYSQDSLNIFEKIGDTWGIAWILYNISYIRLCRGDNNCIDIIERALIGFNDIKNEPGKACCIIHLALAFAINNKVNQSALLYGIGMKMINGCKENISPMEQIRCDNIINLIHTNITNITSNRNYQKGYLTNINSAYEILFQNNTSN